MCSRNVAKAYPDVIYGEHLVDNTCMQLVTNPYQYDMLLLENLYGDIISDLCAAFVGGLGLVPGANLGSDCAIFEAVHGSAPDIAGKKHRQPDCTAAIGGADATPHRRSGRRETVSIERLRRYMNQTMLTRDVGGTAGTTENSAKR